MQFALWFWRGSEGTLRLESFEQSNQSLVLSKLEIGTQKCLRFGKIILGMSIRYGGWDLGILWWLGNLGSDLCGPPRGRAIQFDIWLPGQYCFVLSLRDLYSGILVTLRAGYKVLSLRFHRMRSLMDLELLKETFQEREIGTWTGQNLWSWTSLSPSLRRSLLWLFF